MKIYLELTGFKHFKTTLNMNQSRLVKIYTFSERFLTHSVLVKAEGMTALVKYS